MLDQSSLRKTKLNQRKKLSKDVVEAHSAVICTRLANLPEFNDSQIIAAYWPMSGEIDTHALISLCWKSGKKCYLPKIKPSFQMEFYQYEQDTPLELNSMSIAEPMNSNLISPDQLDVVLTPVVAFDASGHRLGFGLGFYDRCFAFLQNENKTAIKPILIGLAHAFQEVPAIDPNPWDVPLNKIITETGIFNCR